MYKFGLSVCLYPINVKKAEPIGPKFFVGPHVIPGKVYECVLKVFNFVKKFKYLKIRGLLFKNSQNLFLLCFRM